MSIERKGLGIIFHSGSFDRLHHGLSIALAALALGRDVKLFFTYWALEHLKKKKLSMIKYNREARGRKKILEKGLKEGHIKKFFELVTETKKIGARLYVCSGSLGLLNISRNELAKQVDKSMGITTFLTETIKDQVIFI